MASKFGFIGDNQELGSIGGSVIKQIATAALLIGDGVFHSGDDEVDKSTTAGDRLLRAGIVVGGDNFGDREALRSDEVGKAAAGAGGEVMVCHSGVAWATAGDEIVNGDQLMFDSATAGRLIAATPTTDAGKIVGTALTAAAADGDPVKVLISLC